MIAGMQRGTVESSCPPILAGLLENDRFCVTTGRLWGANAFPVG